MNAAAVTSVTGILIAGAILYLVRRDHLHRRGQIKLRLKLK